MQAMRVYAAVGASLGWFALALQLYLLLVLARSVGLMLNVCEFVELWSLRENSTYKLSPEGTVESQSCPNYRIGRPCSVDFIGQASAATAPSEMRLGVRA
jgi:hypothetical protein